MNRKYKIFLIVLVLVIIVLFLFLFLQKKGTKEIIKEPGVIKQEPVVEINGDIISLKWDIKNPDIKTESISYIINRTSINKEYIQKVLNIFGFNNNPAVDDNNILMFVNNTNNTSLDINKETNSIKYAKNLLIYPLNTNSNKLDEKIIENNIIKFISNNFLIDKRLGLEINRVNYENVYGPRYVTVNKNDSKIISFTLNYMVSGIPVYSVNGQPIIVKTDWNGNILNFSIETPFEIIKEEENIKLKDFEEIKNTPLSKFRLFDVYGGKNFDSTSNEEKIKDTTVTNIKNCFIYTNTDNILHPYYILEGNTSLPFSGAVITNIILKADSENK